MATDEELRARIIEAAADLFAQYGFSGTKVNMVAKAARVSSQTVRRLTGGRADLFEQVAMARVSSSVAEVRHRGGEPGRSAGHRRHAGRSAEVFTSPEASWGLLELEALTPRTPTTLHEIGAASTGVARMPQRSWRGSGPTAVWMPISPTPRSCTLYWRCPWAWRCWTRCWT